MDMPDLTPYPPLNFLIAGLIGALLYILSAKLLWDTEANVTLLALRRIGEGAILGIVVFILGLPNSLTALTAGYVGIDWIEGIIYKRQEKPLDSSGMAWYHVLAILAGALIAGAGLLIILIDFPTGITDPVGYAVFIGGLALAFGAGYLGKPR